MILGEWARATAIVALWTVPLQAAQQQAGSIRGVVLDADFNVPLGAVQVLVVETGAKATSGEQGDYVLPQLPPGRYTLVFSKDGYVRQVRTDVLVNAGQLTDIDVLMAGEFTDMEEFVVEDLLKLDTGAEIALLDLRFESPALLDSIGAELMSRAGASDAASALRLVAGATVQDGKYAVVRGLPDRYVSSQLNGVRLPSADEDKRAVELDQFPSAVIDNIRVSKTFTPDQQGDASGGAVDIRLRTVPSETVVQVSSQVGFNTNAGGRNDFLTYDGGGVSTWGRVDDRNPQPVNAPWTGAVGVSEDDSPIDHKWNMALGGKLDLSEGVKLGGFGTFFYERDSSYYDDGISDSRWVTAPGAGMTPEFNQGTPTDGDFRTQLFDVTQAAQSVQWGGMGLVGLETENHALNLAYLYTRVAEDVATLAEDTRGKQHFYPGFDPNDPNSNGWFEGLGAPYLRLETLEYTERTTNSLLLNGRHTMPTSDTQLGAFRFTSPEVDWTLSASEASLYQPDKRIFGGAWNQAGFPSPIWIAYKPAANFNLGNLQRIWKSIDEESRQGSLNLKLPFEQWSESPGYVKFGAFSDRVDRAFDQDTYTNPGFFSFNGDFDESWSAVFPSQNIPIQAATTDVDYDGEIKLDAYYGMMDLPLNDNLNLIGGVRREHNEIEVINDPDVDAQWFPPGATALQSLDPGEADVQYRQNSTLPSIGLSYEPMERLVFRANYAETVARQTFKELTPVIQQEYLGGPIFIGEPALEISQIRNYDLRVDYTPYEGGFMSASFFYKDITDPIEYVQRAFEFSFTTARNYPQGRLRGIELELRHDLGQFVESLEGLSVGVNGTLIDSQVTLPDDEVLEFQTYNFPALHTRDMLNAPERLLNLYLLYDKPDWGTQAGLFFTFQGDTLVAGAGMSRLNFFVPNVYAKEYETVNFSISQRLGKYFTLQFQAKNLTNPTIEEVYRSSDLPRDVTRTSFTRGIDLSLTLGARFSF